MNTSKTYYASDESFSFFPPKLEDFRQNFSGGDFYSSEVAIHIKSSALDILTRLKNAISVLGLPSRIESATPWTYLVYVGTEVNKRAMLKIYFNGDDNDISQSNTQQITFGVYGELDLVTTISKLVRGFNEGATPNIRWYYIGDGGIRSHDVELISETTAVDEMYPWVPEGLDKFFDSYLSSTASVLILLGEAGTGKTSFLREMIIRKKLRAMVTYEEELMTKDRLFVELMTSRASDIIIVEDADTLLLPRDTDGNKVMAKFLNVSDGLLKSRRKKMVFTANINFSNMSKIDSALIRPGRCFRVLEFRAMTHAEALRAAAALNINAPEDNGDVTLAQITNNAPIKNSGSSFGFIPQSKRNKSDMSFLGGPNF